MTVKEYELVCLLIDRNTEVSERTFDDYTEIKISEKRITQLKEDLKVLIDKEVK